MSTSKTVEVIGDNFEIAIKFKEPFDMIYATRLLEDCIVKDAVERYDGNRTKAAKAIGMQRTALLQRIISRDLE